MCIFISIVFSYKFLLNWCKIVMVLSTRVLAWFIIFQSFFCVAFICVWVILVSIHLLWYIYIWYYKNISHTKKVNLGESIKHYFASNTKKLKQTVKNFKWIWQKYMTYWPKFNTCCIKIWKQYNPPFWIFSTKIYLN